MKKKGVLITLDGSNGSGKTTVKNAIEEFFLESGIDYMLTREPGGTPMAEEIRETLLSKRDEPVSSTAELLLFAAARAQHVEYGIIPAINAGKVCLTDRFHPATSAFQGYGRGLSLSLISSLRDIALNGFREDMNIILDLCPEEGVRRVRERGDGMDRFDSADIEFLRRARDGYLELATAEPDRYRVVDASQPLGRVVSEVIDVVKTVITWS